MFFRFWDLRYRKSKELAFIEVARAYTEKVLASALKPNKNNKFNIWQGSIQEKLS